MFVFPLLAPKNFGICADTKIVLFSQLFCSHPSIVSCTSVVAMLRRPLLMERRIPISQPEEYQDLISEAERRLVSGNRIQLVSDVSGMYSHHQLLDLFVLSSIGMLIGESIRKWTLGAR